ncbi:hypothetical protein [Allobaculum stercoricanis]|uniref:PTS sugar transporter subunit IIA domain-containing protein n=1 Tax=Allobaculum stercoricanis TaxID=174709 RepID=UPI000377ED19|nr:hypothetical protein [Allobaculum stercoricanis]
MRKLVLFGEGNFGPALLESALTISNGQADADTFALDGTDVLKFRRNFESVCNTVYNKDSLLLLSDLSTSSVSQEAWLVLEKRDLLNRMLFVSGASVPTVMAALAYKDEVETDEELMKVLGAQTKSSLIFFGS